MNLSAIYYITVQTSTLVMDTKTSYQLNNINVILNWLENTQRANFHYLKFCTWFKILQNNTLQVVVIQQVSITCWEH